MSDPVTPLNHARFDGYVTIAEAGPTGMITLRGDLADPHLSETLHGVIGAGVPARGRAEVIGDNTICWMSPDELLLMAPRSYVPDALARIASAMGDRHHLAADVSDARAMIRLQGRALREVLAKLSPADLSPAASPPGTIRRTRLAQVPAAILFQGPDRADVLCFRSVARYVFGLLSNAARPGSEVHRTAGAGNPEQ
ncbi:sarcosine oxidase subunit gamma [Oceaniglobus indicus]|uniref:sarcosine oxidase subunit gamma n=1 Tax=Oceaniglobus indicus TaxID=2047749 RepID=UPI000C18C15E|nr:sarcosine oxidase subunit gamma family protein [Oceaniglobus indicus]